MGAAPFAGPAGGVQVHQQQQQRRHLGLCSPSSFLGPEKKQSRTEGEGCPRSASGGQTPGFLFCLPCRVQGPLVEGDRLFFWEENRLCLYMFEPL